MKKLIKNGNDFVLGIVVLVLSGFLLLSPAIVKGQALVNMGGFFARADVYIKMLAIILLALAAYMLIKSINFKGTDEVIPIQIPITKEVVLTAVALILYVLLLPVIHFVPSTLLLVSFLVILFSLKENQDTGIFKDPKALRKLILFAIVYAVVLVAILYVVFTKLLGSVLP